jgi:hypothetical protein
MNSPRQFLTYNFFDLRLISFRNIQQEELKKQYKKSIPGGGKHAKIKALRKASAEISKPLLL